MKNGVDTAKQQLPSGEDPNSVTNLFVAPEFYFHGIHGPYVYANDNDDPAQLLLHELKNTFNPNEYPNWTFVFGSAITTQVKDINTVYNQSSTQVRNSIVKNLSEQWLASFGPLKGVDLRHAD